MKVSEVLTKAADILQERGWTRKTYIDKKGRVCARGAIRIAVSGFAEGKNVFEDDCIYNIRDTDNFLQEFLISSPKNKVHYMRWKNAITVFNDNVASDSRDVIRLFKRAAKAAAKKGL